MRRIVGLLVLGATVLCAEDQPTAKALQEKLDWEIAARTLLQAQNLQSQMQIQVTPLLKEREDALRRICKSYNLSDDDCMVTESTRTVAKKTAEQSKELPKPDKDPVAKK